MADEDDQNVRMLMSDRDYVTEDSDNDDDIRRGEIEHMDDLGEDEGDKDESDNNDDDEVEDEEEEEEDEEDEEEEEVSNESVHKFIQTFHTGDFDAKFDNALSSDRSAVVPNTWPTQASYNKPDNWRERNGIGLEKVKEQLQTCIDLAMHNGSLQLNFSNQDQLMDNEEPIVWHEPILDEYWDQFKAEIDQKKQLEEVTDICGFIY